MKFLYEKFLLIFVSVVIITLPFSLKAEVLPNDPWITNQGYLEQIHAFEAWEKSTGSDEVVIAVIDSGVYIEHPDLIDNIWTNNDEIANDGVDNDFNGYIDDYHGWDFVANSPDPNPKVTSNFSQEGLSHGTFIAGIIAARGNNNIGITGLAWNSRIMPLRVLDSQGNGNFDNIIEATNYAVANGADILNYSLVSIANVSTLNDAIENAFLNGKIIVAAAGNDGLVIEGFDGGYNLDFFPYYPVCHDGDDNNVLGVVSVDEADIKSYFSNYGPSCVDLSAPGENFFGLNYYDPLYPEFWDYYQGNWSGTSMAAPLVSGAAALLKSLRPDLNNTQIYDLLISNGDDISLLNPYYISRLGKRLNLESLFEQAEAYSENQERKVIVSPVENYPPIISIFDLTGNKLNEFYAYNINFFGGVNITSGNVKSDWPEEIISGAGQGGGPHIRVFNQAGSLLSQFFAYPEDFSGGVKVATLKYSQEAERKIITAPQNNYKSLIKIFDYHGNLLNEFLAFPEEYSGGISITSGDVNEDGIEEIIVAKSKEGSLVRIFNQQGNLLSEFEAYNQGINGLNLALVKAINDQPAKIITSPVSDYQVLLKEFDFRGNLFKQFLIYEENYNLGANIIGEDIDQDGIYEIMTAPNNNYLSEIRSYNQSGELKLSFWVFSGDSPKGINLSTIN